MLVLELFGTGHAYYAEQPLPGFPGRQPWLLFCYLLLHRRQPLPRERLAAVFWGDYSTSVSRKHLRNALWRMRYALQSAGARPDDYLLVSEDAISFSPSARYSLDIEDFEAKITAYQHLSGPELTPDMALQLEQAVDLYTGDLLTGIYADWSLLESERLNLLYLNTLGKLMDFYEFQGDAENGLACGRRLLACDNTREKVHRQMMRLYWLAGDRGAALAQFNLCAQILADTLGVSPLPETTQLYRQMKEGCFEPELWGRRRRVRPQSGSCAEEVQMALFRLRQLQVTVEQVGAELERIERQLDHALRL